MFPERQGRGHASAEQAFNRSKDVSMPFHAAPAWSAVCLVGLELAVNQFDRNGAADGLRCCRATEFLPRQAQMEAYRAFRNSQHCSNLLWESSLCYQIDALKLSGG